MTKDLWKRQGPPSSTEWVEGNRITYDRLGTVDSIAYAAHFEEMRAFLKGRVPDIADRVKQACEFLGEPIPEHVKK